MHSARLNPANPIETRTASSPDWFLDWAFEEIQRVAEGRGHYVLTARTTIDLNLQQAAEQALTSTIRQHGRNQNARSGALVSMEPDGAVRALVGGTDYGESQFNRATHARRQPGSSFKLYVYANAVERGLTPKSIVRDAQRRLRQLVAQELRRRRRGGGSMPAGIAFAKSLNTVAVDLSLKYDRDRVVEMTRRFGVEGVKKTCSMALGDTGITPLQHTAAYSTFANDGILTKPYAILDITNSRGELIYTRDRDEPPAPRVLSRRVVEQMNQMMHQVVMEGTGRRAQLDFTYTAGKTGTSSSYRDAWFVGFTGQYVTGVWIGNDDYRPMNNVTGGTIPTLAWHSYMSVAHTNMDIPPIPGLAVHPGPDRRASAPGGAEAPAGDRAAGQPHFHQPRGGNAAAALQQPDVGPDARGLEARGSGHADRSRAAGRDGAGRTSARQSARPGRSARRRPARRRDERRRRHAFQRDRDQWGNRGHATYRRQALSRARSAVLCARRSSLSFSLRARRDS